MRLPKPITFLLTLALCANLLTLILYQYAGSQPGGTGIDMVFILYWMPFLWLIAGIAALVTAIIKRKIMWLILSL